MRVRGRLLGGAAALVALLAAAPAQAGVTQAQTILPPGESGFVSIPGVAAGTGSDHLYDQQQPFIAFQRKNALFDRPQAGTESPKPGVTIARDSFGVPSITGDSDGDAWWGVGYATAQDRLFELEIFKRATTGHLAEILGSSYIPMDIATRRDFYTPAELDQLFAQLPPFAQARYQAYLDGINAWVDHLQANPTETPGEFLAVADPVRPFSIEDLLAISVYLARTTPNGDGNDLANARALQQSGAAAFNRILPLRIKGQLSTIPRSDGLFPSVPGRSRKQERRALRRSAAFVRPLSLPGSDADGTEPVSRLAPTLRGSYMVAIGNRRRHRAVLFNGPELGFSAPEELYEFEVHEPGLDAHGISAPGAPVVAIGFNQHVAWGLTSGLSQTNALYAERLVPGQPDQYVFNGAVKQMDCREEVFNWNTPPTSLPDLLTSPGPPSGSKTVRICRTIHGPVQARAGDFAFARRYATWGREQDTLLGLMDVDKAQNIKQVDKAASELTWNENLMAADDRGNIGYWHPGLMPRRPKGWDERLPYPGTGQAEWQGFLPVRQRPHVINPRNRSWLSNWNNLPSQGWTTGNDPASERVAGAFFRVGWLNRLVMRYLVPHPSFASMERVVHDAGTISQPRELSARRLAGALKGSSGDARSVLETILAWDGSYNETDSNGKTDPGASAWLEFRDQAQKLALGPLGAAGQIIGGEAPNDEHVFDVSLGQAYALRTLGPSGYRRAAAAAFAALSQRFGSADPSAWRAPRAMFEQSALGAEQPPDMPFFDRGTYEQIVALAGGG